MTKGQDFARRSLLALAADALIAPLSAKAQVAASRGDDKADIARAEAYLDSIRTLESRFLQIGPDGSVAEGAFYLSRPGKLRLDYDAPNPNLLVADGRFFVHIDRYLKTIAYLPIDSTPAGLLVRERIRLSDDVRVVGVERGPAVLRIAVVQAADPRAGRLVLAFSDRPFALASWSFVDSQGQTTRLTLIDPKFGGSIDPTKFTFVDPNRDAPTNNQMR
ncbi:MAG: outer membrane lipoprotein carrier protein LolA [Alphaproteobacteria bacterium]|nr:outer membrane lipoprotein carrier protein LolA [Alphaproteobacteria bacterium]